MGHRSADGPFSSSPPAFQIPPSGARGFHIHSMRRKLRANSRFILLPEFLGVVPASPVRRKLNLPELIRTNRGDARRLQPPTGNPTPLVEYKSVKHNCIIL